MREQNGEGDRRARLRRSIEPVGEPHLLLACRVRHARAHGETTARRREVVAFQTRADAVVAVPEELGGVLLTRHALRSRYLLT